MINPVIVGALVVQAVVSQTSRLSGAVLGFMITGGILAWGMATYASGGFIQFFNVQLSEQAFIGLCLVWFCFDLAAYRRARAAEQAEPTLAPPIVENSEQSAQDVRVAHH